MSAVMSLAIFWSASALAQEAAPAAAGEQPSFPFVGEVRADRLNVRLSPQAAGDSPIIHILSRGNQVTVIGQEGGFYKIQPPEGSGLWVWTRNLRAGDDGWGTTTQEAPLRLDSRVTATEITRIPSGTRVKILREHLGWHKVQPPNGVFFYVSARYVQPSGAAAVAQPAPDALALALLDRAYAAAHQADMALAAGDLTQADYQIAADLCAQAAAAARADEIRRQAESFQRQCENMQRLVAMNIETQRALARAERTIQQNQPPRPPEYNFRGYVAEVGACLDRPTQWRLTTRRGTLETVCYVIIDNPELERRWLQNWGRYAGVVTRSLGRAWRDAPLVRLERIDPLDAPPPQGSTRR